jgi:hypothetical protein
MLLDTSVTVGQNVRAFLNKNARGKVVAVNGSLLTVQWEGGNMVEVNRFSVIVMKPGY